MSLFVRASERGAEGIRPAQRAFQRGGNWNNGSNAGVFTLNLNNAPTNTNTNIGFRCARYFQMSTMRPECALYGACARAARRLLVVFPLFEFPAVRPRLTGAIWHLNPGALRIWNDALCSGYLGAPAHMRQHTTLFDTICDIENIHRAWRAARRCKRYRAEILRFGYHVEDELLALRRELMSKTYCHGEYRHFVVHDAKKRRIQSAPFRDRVVHHALCARIEPLFERGFIFDSYACRKGKGTHAAVRRLETFLRSCADSSGASGGGYRKFTA